MKCNEHDKDNTNGDGILKRIQSSVIPFNELEETQYQPLEQSDIKEIIHDVLQELQARKRLS